ncbi:carbohydrate ABC transporter permease [Halobacillus yeomjeoni]|uniref:Carbohydrate ABC transporter permease n=1 Tax=Halobacillus yeomjeoni TaxID=311194 RepID=A0A931HW85_9BACI|nr:carbohydrate ABC transporter permease [Halobacillus yeomjeoni]MBH0230659.1 carbohydrate ABC transporter permease [Halobacillus yeomjeoni]MCA0985259.1 carbohydrate ABC transporter permease [Halobacillus yeomjeoni]
MDKQKKVVWTILGITVSLMHIIPFYILMTTSFKNSSDFSSKWLFPDYLDFSNFSNAWTQAQMGTALFNNVVITVISVTALIVLGSLAAYPLARVASRLNKVMYISFVAVMIVPPLTILVPLYKFIVDIGGLNTIWAVVLVHVSFWLPLTIFLYTGFIRSTIPKELDEAAMIDGASRLQIFFRVVFPLLKPVTASVIIITGMFVWNDYQFSVFFLQDKDAHTITVALSQFFSQYSNDVGLVAAGSLLGMLPMVIVFLFLQKYFIAGLSSGSVKG